MEFMEGVFLSANKVDVFVSLGTHPQSFLRLLNEVARLAERGKLNGKVVVQAGYTPFTHSKMEIVDFLSIEAFDETLNGCKLFITHAGEGNIGQALLKKKCTVVVPRKMEWGEHTDNHQDELARAMSEEAGIVVIENIANLEEGINLALKQEVTGKLDGYITRILEHEAREAGVLPVHRFPNEKKSKWTVPRSASIVVASFNGGEPLINAVKGMLNQDFSGKWEVIVVDDGSFDGKTPDLLRKNFGKNQNVTLIFLPRSGVCKTRNAGIRAAKYDVVINMDHDDNPEKDWLRIMMRGFDSPNVGAVSGYGHFGGTSTGFRKDILNHLGGYDEDYFYYREDTDLSFRVMELGFEYRKVEGAKWHGDRTLVTPRGMGSILRYTIQRFTYHMNDVLLHKKHSGKRVNDFLHVIGIFFVNPVEDFNVATGLWKGDPHTFELSSPRGMTFLSNTGVISFILIVMVGLGYAFGIKWARLAGSLKHGHLLI